MVSSLVLPIHPLRTVVSTQPEATMSGSPVSSTESLSPDTSTGSSPGQASKKRTRASKPKVRTGCITWYDCSPELPIPLATCLSSDIGHCSKIRRVKCGEEKPACLRCTSTGRTCDGYDTCLSPLWNRPARDPLEEAELAKSEFLKACQHNEALRYMRPLAPDIDGSKIDKRFLRLPPVATSTGSTFHRTFATFWSRVSSQHHGDHAIRHALVALGATQQLFGPSELPLPEGFTPESLEIFAIQRYNMSICRLQPHISSSNPESVRITLICCLAFIFLETLRSNHDVAITHLVNGLRILESLPAPSFCYHYTGAEGFNPEVFSMSEVIDLFGSLEFSACFFPTAIRPFIAEHGYRSRLFYDGSDDPPFSNLTHVHATLTRFQRDVMARMSEVSSQNPPICPVTQQQSALWTRSQRLDLLLSEFLSCAYLAHPDIPEHDTFQLHLTLLHFRCSQLLLLHDTPAPPRREGPDIHLDILRLATQLQSCLPPPSRRRDSPVACTDTPLAAPLYLLAVDSGDNPPVRAQALQLLARALLPGGSYEAVVRVARGLERVVSKTPEGPPTLWSALGLDGWAGENGLVPCALTGLGCLPGVWSELARLDGEE
ncbi:transcriptional regulatory protein moc3 [Podospora conica]|nr:transcriptional regulatory protein moc3 [Schizothecium conicum]